MGVMGPKPAAGLPACRPAGLPACRPAGLPAGGERHAADARGVAASTTQYLATTVIGCFETKQNFGHSYMYCG